MQRAFLTLTFLSALFGLPAFADSITGKVVGVSDGDTITVLDAKNIQFKVRLSGIDAPEKNQPFGENSKKSLSDMTYMKSVRVESSKKDRYQRTVSKVLVDGLDVNLEQVKRGLAWHYTKYQKQQPYEDRESYYNAQKSAENSMLGVWAESKPVAPWEWRKARHKN